MNNILVLNSSVLGEASVSKTLVEEAVQRLLERNPQATVVRRDLGTEPIAHLITASVAGVRGVPTTEAELAVINRVNPLGYEVDALRGLLIGTPAALGTDLVVLVVAAAFMITVASALLPRLAK